MSARSRMADALEQLTVFAFASSLVLGSSALGDGSAAARSYWFGKQGRGPVTSPAVICENRGGNGVLSFTIEFPGLEVAELVTDAGGFTRFSIPDTGVTGVPGVPELPVYRKTLHLDPAWTYACRFKVVREQGDILRRLDLPPNPPPARRAVPKRPGALEAARLEHVTLQHALVPPPEAVRLRELGIVQDRKLVLIEVSPVLHNVSSGRVTWRQTIHIDIVKTGKDAAWRDDEAAPAGLAVPSIRPGPEHDAFETPITTSGDGPPMRLLIVAADALSPTLDGFMAHKGAQGWTVDRITVGAAGGTRETIREHIRARYLRQDLRPTHLLLVGDSDTIPPWPGQGAYTPDTDLYYACMDGVDDWLPDMACGRLPARTPGQLENMIEKIIYHETSVSPATTFVENAGFAASSDNHALTEGTHNTVIIRHMDPRGYVSSRLYSYTYGATRTNMAAALDAGLGLMIYSGHAYAHRWRDPAFDVADVHALNNQAMTPFVMSFACDSGAFATLDESFAEAWLRAGDRSGAVAMLASSDDSYWEEDDVLQRALFDAIFDAPGAPLGDLVLDAKMRYLAHYGPHSETLQYFEQYHLFGDPTMPLVVMEGSGINDLAAASRNLPEGCMTPGAAVAVSLALTVADPPPNALIIKEKLPAGWTVADARWNGSPMEPSMVAGEYRWLFGVGTPVGDGTLTYTTQATGNPGDLFVLTGTLLYGTTTVATRGDQQLRFCAIIDTDGDGIPDDWEILHFGGPTNAVANRDYDGDGMTALHEYLADTDPHDPKSSLAIDAIAITAEGVRIDWRGGTAAVQYLESSTDLSDPEAWEVRKIIIPPTPVKNSWTDHNTARSGKRFYRIRASR